MRNMPAAVTAALTCLLAGAALSGCGGDGGTEDRSAEELLDDANDTMRALKSVTVEVTSTATKGGTATTRLVTDLDKRCRARTSWSEGGTLEQIRIGDTDYVRPDRAYLQKWNGDTSVKTEQRFWFKSPVEAGQDGENGLTSCERPYDSFGTATKGEPTHVDGKEAIALKVTDEADKGGTYTFYVATQGRPYLLKTVYEGGDFHTTTSFGDFDETLDVHAPKAAEVLDAGDLDR
ncbi:hypothetical protein ABZ848_20810 [Streptomyces sp. NPDC047081]|uniref:hypothetical protein n=1 Tax=Streptomyces sp. NPDC047081 TaxID=3154706 RepID=UPI0033C8B9C1